MRTARYIAQWAAILFWPLMLATSCVSMEAPKSFNDRLAYAYSSVAATRNTTAALLERKRISKADAIQIQALADQARTGLDLSRGTAASGDLATAQGQLQLALDVLTKIEAYLATKGAP
jgi:hypothetical protein